MKSLLVLRHLLRSQYGLIIFSATILTLFYNSALSHSLLKFFPIADGYLVFYLSVFVVLWLLQIALLSVFASRYTTKVILIVAFLIAAFSHYFMTTYGLVIDEGMLMNAIETDQSEVAGLVSFPLVMQFVFLGLIPSLIIIKWPTSPLLFLSDLKTRVSTIVVALVISSSLILLSSADFTSFFREYKIIRLHANPLFPIYSMTKLGIHTVSSLNESHDIVAVSEDAKIVEEEVQRKELVIVVVGETARADHFQINGYNRPTNPYLSKITNLVSFNNAQSCGTSTGVSVPCMFLSIGRKDYETGDIKSYENALDVLDRAGVNVLWRDNNSSSKGVADRIEYQNFRSPNLNSVCDPECRDVGMLSKLDNYIETHSDNDNLIVLHQMGSHGPEYFRRYPEDFDYFSPTCKSKKLGECNDSDLINAYDNTIRYTDYFLAQVIDLLKQYDSTHEVAMLYMSDHGESLGENGIYLHAMPYQLAPKSQTNVPLIIWTGKHFDFSATHLDNYRDQTVSQDDLFCSLMTAFEVQTEECDGKNSLFMPELMKVS